MARKYKLTVARRRALRKAQRASARKRFGTSRHEMSYWVGKGIKFSSRVATVGTSSKIASFQRLMKEGRKKR